MTDPTMTKEIADELDRAVQRLGFGAVDAAGAVRAGRQLRRRRTARRVLGGAATLAVVGVVGLAGTRLTGDGAEPSPAFGDPGSRLVLAADGGAEDGYPDLVVSARGDTWVTITGFGWPIEGMAEVSDRDGAVSLPEISKLDAESMCLPMLIQAAPEVPNSSWRHSEGWIDDFPTRAGLVTSFEAEHDGRTYSAACTLPGDFAPVTRPDLDDVPVETDSAAILRQCSYQGHVDFRGWEVGAADAASHTLSAALVSPDGHVARCVLSTAARERVTQLSSTTVAGTEVDSPVLYGGDRTRTLTLAGAVAPEVAAVEVVAAGERRVLQVEGGVFAAAVDLDAKVLPDDAVVRTFDADGDELHVVRAFSEAPPEGMLLPALCFTAVETGSDGC